MGISNRRTAMLTALAAALLVFGVGPASAAAAPTRGYASVPAPDGTSIVSFDPATNTITDRVPLDFTTFTFEVRPDGREIYVADLHGDRIVVISTATHTVVATIPVGTRPEAVTFTPDSRRAFVTNSEDVSVIDTATRRVIATIPVGDLLLGSAASPDGTKVYTTAVTLSGANYTLRVISTATNTITKTIRLRTGGLPPDVVRFAPNGSVAMLDTGEVIDARNDNVVRRITLDLAQDFEFAPTSDRVYVAHMCSRQSRGSIVLVEVASGRLIRTITTVGNPHSLEVTSDDTRLYVSAQGSINELDAATGRVLDTFGVSPTAGALQVELSDTAPPPTAPGQRFAPRPPGLNPCIP